MTRLRISAAVGICALGSGCGGARDEDESASVSITAVTLTTSSPSGTDPGTEGATGPLDDADATAEDGQVFDVLVGEVTGADSGEDCAALEQEGEVGLQPADIIVVIDNSGSMDYEAGLVQDYMNAFSSQIFLANIDAHVVVISSYPDATGVCIDPPLGSGGCPATDNNPPGFTHINDAVDSNNALQKLIDHHADWAPVMRMTASKHIIIVTDDNSDLSSAEFQAAWAALDPSYVPYKVHAIAATQDPVTSCIDGNASGCCAISAAPGTVYQQLCTATMGVFGNLCDQEFQPIFDAVAQEVISGSAIACEFAIPEAPPGETFDPMEVNVQFDDGIGTFEIGYVEGPAECGGVDDGWYYDDPANPTTILLCPQTCETIQGFEMAKIFIGFGCATIPAG